MNQMLRIFILSFICLFSITLNATEYELKLKSGNFTLPELSSTTDMATLEESILSNYAIVQFYEIPTKEQKIVLRQNGIQLLEYLPQNAFIAKLKSTKSTSGKLNIRGVIAFTPKFKFFSSFSLNDIPLWANQGNQVDLMIETHLDVSEKEFTNFLNLRNIKLLRETAHLGYYEIRISKKDINVLSNSELVKVIDFIPAPPQKESDRGRSLHRGNLLDSDAPMGRKYDGTGVSISIADDGLVGPHIDTKGRITQYVSVDNGSHGDMTTGIAMGAGNLNPYYKGMATGAYLHYYNISGYPHISNAVSNLNTLGVVITSTSYSEGCNAGYTSTTRTVDQQTRQNPTLLHVFSAGNSSQSTCGSNAYGAGVPWGTITGGRKQGKTTIATGNITYNANLANSSSRGPAADGRIKPDICAYGNYQYSTDPNNSYSPGSGTSAAAPGIAGIAAQIYHGYRNINNGNTPESGLIKAAILNTGRDLGNKGPDFTYGWGRINAHRAMTLLEENRYLADTIVQSGMNSHSINIPSGMTQVKFMLYWTDYEATTNAAIALVNNIDLKVINPNGDTLLPWILNSSPNSASLSQPATKGVDNLNNMEQVEIDTAMAGTYTLLVNGKAIPQGPQKYFIVWENLKNEIEVTYPSGGESFAPGSGFFETLRWDAIGNSGTFLVEYSIDSGSTWSTISTISGSARAWDWSVPNVVSSDALIRVSRAGISGISNSTFDIIQTPSGLRSEYICPDSVKLAWNTVSGATEYEIYQLGATYMDSIGRSDTTNFKVYNLNLTADNWFSVKAIGNGIEGRRAEAILLDTAVNNCPFNYDLEISQILSPEDNYLLNCGTAKTPVQLSIINNGDSTLKDIPIKLSDGINTFIDTISGPLSKGVVTTFTFKDSLNLSNRSNIIISVVNLLANDQFEANDSLSKDITVLNNQFGLPYSNDFESFNLCATTNNCGGTVCNLSGGWHNVENGVGDDYDMRVNSGTTPSSSTGPSQDHNPGNSTGKYIYSEASNGCYYNSSRTISPCFDLSNTFQPEFSFWYHMYGTSQGRIQVDVYSNGTWTNNVIIPIIGNKGNTWLQQTIDMTAFVGTVVNFRFTITTGANYFSDVAIDDVSFIDRSTGIENAFTKSNIKIYPNPSKGKFTLQLDNLQKQNIQIKDLSGRVLREIVVREKLTLIDLSQHAKGIYFIELKGIAIKKKVVVY